MLRGPGARGGEQQEQTILAPAVQHRRSLFLAGGKSELVRVPGPGPRQVAGRDGGVWLAAVKHAALPWLSGTVPSSTLAATAARARVTGTRPPHSFSP